MCGIINQFSSLAVCTYTGSGRVRALTGKTLDVVGSNIMVGVVSEGANEVGSLEVSRTGPARG